MLRLARGSTIGGWFTSGAGEKFPGFLTLDMSPCRSMVLPPPLTVMLPWGFALRVPLIATPAPATVIDPFCRSCVPEPVTHRPHWARPPGTSWICAAALTGTLLVPQICAKGVATWRIGTLTRTDAGVLAKSNEMQVLGASGGMGSAGA